MFNFLRNKLTGVAKISSGDIVAIKGYVNGKPMWLETI